MRDIRFRVWDGANRKMIIFDSPSIYTDSPTTGLTFWLNSGRDENGDKSEGYRPDVDSESPTLMQYTGLKDKNGVEIYEGDIVEFSGYKKDRIELIEWENIGKHTSFGAGTHNARVIGNIHQHPELLKDSNV